MRKSLLILSVVVLSLMMITGASAQGMFGEPPPWLDEVPQLDPPAWEAGQFATYRIAIEVEGESINADMRFAIIGVERIAGQDYFWFEFDLFNIGNLPEDIGMMMDEGFDSFKVQILMQEYEMKAAQEDPEAFMEDLFSLKFIKRIIFQVNDDTPVEIDMTILQMFAPMLEMSMETAMDEEMMGDQAELWADADWGYEYVDVKTPAGTFSNALLVWFDVNDATMAMQMNVSSHPDVPLSMLVKLDGTVHEPSTGEDVNMDFVIIDYGNDAGGWITGEPELMSFDMLGEMMGGMMGGM